MAWCVDDLDDQLSEVQLLAVSDLVESEYDVGRFVQPQSRLGCLRELAVTGDVVGVQVGIEDISDRVTALVGEGEILLDIELRVNDRGLTRLPRRKEIAGAAGLIVQEL